MTQRDGADPRAPSCSRSWRSRCRSWAPTRGTSGRRAWTRRGRSPRSCAPPARSGTSASLAHRAFLAALLCGGFATVLLTRSRPAVPAWTGVALVLAVGVLLAAPSTLLQLGLRDSTAPWFFTNDSTYQVELGGDLVLDGDNPYGHDYTHSGLERFYTRDGSVSERVRRDEVALRHFAYFPGAVLSAAVWRLLPEPFDDYRLLVLLAHAGAAPGGAPVPRAAGLAARARRRAGVQPDRRALRVVRPERRAQPAAAGARLRARDPAALRAGRPRRSPARSC